MKNNDTHTTTTPPHSFIAHHQKDVTGILHGWDRLFFQASFRSLCYTEGLLSYLWAANVLLKDFKDFALSFSKRIKASAQAAADEWNRPYIYLPSSKQNKEKMIENIALQDGISNGLIAVLSAVEPCNTFHVKGNRHTHKLEPVYKPGKCLHHYHYYQHPEFGRLHVRVQNWFPFTVHICMNGRQWLACQMRQAGINFTQRDNTFSWVEDVGAAQDLLDSQNLIDWPTELGKLVNAAHPVAKEIATGSHLDYYYSCLQSELASDVMFKNRSTLEELYPSLIYHGLTTFRSPDILRFLGKKVPKNGGVGNYQGEITSDIKVREEGLRLKHRAKGNSVKLYDKGSVLRAETTVTQPGEFKVYRAKDGEPDGEKDWRPMRKGVADMSRRAEVSHKANERYLEAMASVEKSIPMGKAVKEICAPRIKKKRRHRALNPLAKEDAELLEAINRGEWTINGFRNRDLRELLYGEEKDGAKRKKQSAKITRKLALLRGHGLIRKIPRTHRYQIAEKKRGLLMSCFRRNWTN